LPTTWSRKNIREQYTARDGFYNPRVIARVYAPAARGAGETLDVPGDEAHWLRDVLRQRSGDRVRVFDGRGREYDAAIASATKARVTIELLAAAEARPEPRITYTVAVPVLKGDATDAVVRDVVMLGAGTIRPFVSVRAEVALTAVRRGHRLSRWERVAIASAKQSGRAVVPAIHEPVAFDALLGTEGEGLRLLLVEPACAVPAVALASLPAPAAAWVATGPEGGWTEREVDDAVQAGWRTIRHGGRVLRADAAPLVALAACQAVWQDA
jgi:16S rRNA (uracil1498-N3)-methyltransferase